MHDIDNHGCAPASPFLKSGKNKNVPCYGYRLQAPQAWMEFGRVRGGCAVGTRTPQNAPARAYGRPIETSLPNLPLFLMSWNYRSSGKFSKIGRKEFSKMAKAEIVTKKGRPAPKVAPRKPLAQRIAKTQARVRASTKGRASKG